MRFFDRLSNGWQLGITSLKMIRDNTSLLIFPILSGAALVAICVSFFTGAFAISGFSFEGLENLIDRNGEIPQWVGILGLFLFYLVNYFVIVFFNVGLVYCARQIFEGKEVEVRDGLAYSGSRFSTIFSWAVLAATVGVILRLLEERFGWVGRIIIGLVGIVWTVATFFVVPVIAYENVTPIEAVKRSSTIMREKWGEAIGANFSFGLFFIIGYVAIILTAVALFYFNFPIFAIIACISMALLLHTTVAAAQTVFLAAAYQHVNEEPAGYFDNGDILDSLFVPKKKK